MPTPAEREMNRSPQGPFCESIYLNYTWTFTSLPGIRVMIYHGVEVCYSCVDLRDITLYAIILQNIVTDYISCSSTMLKYWQN